MWTWPRAGWHLQGLRLRPWHKNKAIVVKLNVMTFETISRVPKMKVPQVTMGFNTQMV